MYKVFETYLKMIMTCKNYLKNILKNSKKLPYQVLKILEVIFKLCLVLEKFPKKYKKNKLDKKNGGKEKVNEN